MEGRAPYFAWRNMGPVPPFPSISSDVLRHTSQLSLGSEDVACSVNRDTFTHRAVRRIRHHVCRNEDRHLPVFQTADTDSALPSGMHTFRRLRVGSVDDVILVERETTRSAEVIVFRNEPAVLGQNLDPVIVAIGNDQPALRIKLNRVWSAELARARAGLTDDSEELSVLIEYGNPPHEVPIGDVGMTLRHVDVAVARVCHDIRGIGERLRR